MRSVVAIPYQGGHPVPRTNPAAESWGVFMRASAERLLMNQAEFRRRMDAEGYDISKQTASQWFNGENAPDANKVLAAAFVLEAEDADALRAAGYVPVAERIERGNVKGAGENDRAGDKAADPVIEEIMGLTHLGLKVRQALVAQYLADQEEVRRRARSLARAWDREDGDNGDAGTAA